MKTTQHRYLVLLLLLSISFGSCNFLDFDETNGLKTKEDMYKYFNSTESMLTHVYSFMPQDFGAVDGAMRDCASDDAEFANVAGNIKNLTNGGWSPTKTVDTSWNLYTGIRAANSFLSELKNVDFSRYQYEPNYKHWMRKLEQFPEEAKVLRAHYFFELARRYGDIAMPLTVLSSEEANAIPKTKFNDVIEFIIKECDEAATVLPDSYEGEFGKQTGRVTKGFAQAVKSKALLYAASKLHNSTMDPELWKRSAKAAHDIIEGNIYQLDKDVFEKTTTSKEVIMLRMNEENRNFELNNFPIRFTEGSRTGNVATATFPTQNLVDAFRTKNGHSVVLTDKGWMTDDASFDSKRPYENRDSRFYRTVLANGMKFKDKIIESYIGGLDDVAITAGGTPTGYFLRKYIQESTSFTPDNVVSKKHHWIVYRYAETLLTYAESMANAYPSDMSYVDSELSKSALWALNEVRKNANMPDVQNCSYDEFMQLLRDEWRVEFAFEDHRFWDIRRWKIGDTTQRVIMGVKVLKNVEGSFEFAKTVLKSRVWKDAMYLYPLPQEEIFKNKNLNPQNIGW